MSDEGEGVTDSGSGPSRWWRRRRAKAVAVAAGPPAARHADGPPTVDGADVAGDRPLPGSDLARRLKSAPAPDATPATDAPGVVELATGATSEPPAEAAQASVAVAVEPDAEPGYEQGSTPAAHRRAPRRRLRGLSLVAVVVVAVVASALLRAFVLGSYYIPSASMEPTLHGCPGCNNDHVLVDKLSYKMHDLRRGDVVVFRRPRTWLVAEKLLIKRVIGLPGDVLTDRHGTLYDNGLALQEPYLDKACRGGTASFPAKPVTIPAGHAFVMGDNRCDSSDSRVFGPIPDSSVVGRAFVRIWPWGRVHWL